MSDSSRREALYLHTESNGFRGELISMALVSPCGATWYEELARLDEYAPWVKENVVPKLCNEPNSKTHFRHSLWNFLRAHEGKPIIADRSEDFAYFMSSLCERVRLVPRLALHMNLVVSGGIKSQKPHNALFDAKALMYWDVARGMWRERMCRV